jgi:hypothetical protein
VHVREHNLRGEGESAVAAAGSPPHAGSMIGITVPTYHNHACLVMKRCHAVAPCPPFQAIRQLRRLDRKEALKKVPEELKHFLDELDASKS